ncbi:MAG: hypothetical protein SGCHY_004045 [Lobulomycetales sp.]
MTTSDSKSQTPAQTKSGKAASSLPKKRTVKSPVVAAQQDVLRSLKYARETPGKLAAARRLYQGISQLQSPPLYFSTSYSMLNWMLSWCMNAAFSVILKRHFTQPQALVLKSLLLPALSAVLQYAGGLMLSMRGESDGLGDRIESVCRMFLQQAICSLIHAATLQLVLWHLRSSRRRDDDRREYLCFVVLDSATRFLARAVTRVNFHFFSLGIEAAGCMGVVVLTALRLS